MVLAWPLSVSCIFHRFFFPFWESIYHLSSVSVIFSTELYLIERLVKNRVESLEFRNIYMHVYECIRIYVNVGYTFECVQVSVCVQESEEDAEWFLSLSVSLRQGLSHTRSSPFQLGRLAIVLLGIHLSLLLSAEVTGMCSHTQLLTWGLVFEFRSSFWAETGALVHEVCFLD